MSKSEKKDNKSGKVQDLAKFRENAAGTRLTSNQGLSINDDQNSLKAGTRGPSLLEDFLLREKITHFDHERIPERIVHARGTAAHGYFQVYKSMSPYTKAGFLQDPSARTPVFVRFSTVVGSRGSSDLARDVRGFAVKFYTGEGNYDLVGNNIPVFFIQDAVKFPDLVHAVKPEPHNEMPQAASAHDTFWDFISLMPESMHMIIWVMSDRAIPRSLRMMEGFGVHTFRLINEQGKARFVKFHWKPLLGVHSVAWDEAQKISGKDPDFHRRDLWESIENGDYPEWEFGVQIIEEKDEHKFDFDLLDATKLIPEELVPVQRIGKMTLNRNPDNFFAETEQVSFNPGHLVPGIDLTDDPLLQGRLFSYTDTQLIRLGGPNSHEIPINRPVCPVHNNQRDGHMRQTINAGRVSYEPNSLASGCPMQAKETAGGFVSYTEKINGQKVRGRSEKFFDHFSQAALFWNSQSEAEKAHLVNALRFELGKVEVSAIRERMVGMLAQVDKILAGRVAQGLGIKVPAKLDSHLNHSIPADGNVKQFQPKPVNNQLEKSPALSMANTVMNGVKTRKIAFLIADGFDASDLAGMKKALTAAGAQTKVVAPRLGFLTGAKGEEVKVDFSLLTASSVMFDAVYVPGGEKSIDALQGEPDALNFINEAYQHCKSLAMTGAGVELLRACRPALANIAEPNGNNPPADRGVVIIRGTASPKGAAKFIKAIAQHRHWSREVNEQVPD
ncbi:MAG: catalase [Deltaproteobacteria bacterium]|nr:catalase [Deltaproteobacteria bacterium]